MQKNKDIFVQEFRSRPLAYILQIFGVVVIFLNIWLASKLYPLAKNLDLLTVKVEASESKINSIDMYHVSESKELGKIEVLLVSVEDIKARVERIDTRLSKHLGI